MYIGEHLIRSLKITEEQLKMGLNEAKAAGTPVGDALVRLGFIRYPELKDALMEIAPDALIDIMARSDAEGHVLPQEFLRRTRTIFGGDLGAEIAIATLSIDPQAVAAEAERLSGRVVRIVSANQADFFKGLYIDDPSNPRHVPVAEMDDVNQILTTVIDEAMSEGSSDIHIEQTECTIHIRYRTDGIMHPAHILPAAISDRLYSRIKDKSGMDVSQRREPQDGAFTEFYKGRSIDFRVATIPTATGEKVTLRILDKDRVMVDIRTIGLTAIEDWMFLSHQSNGLILVAGATGSGKTTTLYSTIMSLNRVNKAIYTIEDPVEYRLPCINQIQVNPRTGFTFARALRSFLRHDPDIIVVGEIRDEETAENTIHAADTGHLVYATLHTNDIPTTLTRLEHMKVNIEQLSYSLRGIIVQKLARKLCVECDGKGCPLCNGCGYKGRTLISEFVRIDGPEDMHGLLNRTKPYQTFNDDARIKVLSGITDCKEVSRIMNDDVRFCNGGTCINTHRADTEHICDWVGNKIVAETLGGASSSVYS
jgi:general secretion pathway protein E